MILSTFVKFTTKLIFLGGKATIYGGTELIVIPHTQECTPEFKVKKLRKMVKNCRTGVQLRYNNDKRKKP